MCHGRTCYRGTTSRPPEDDVQVQSGASMMLTLQI